MSMPNPSPVDERWPLSALGLTLGHEGTTTQVGPDRSCNSTWSGPRPASKGTTGLMHSVERASDVARPPTSHPGISRVDGCPECVLNVEPPITSIPLGGDGYRNAYICSDCGHSWVTEWIL